MNIDKLLEACEINGKALWKLREELKEALLKLKKKARTRPQSKATPD